MEPLRDLSAGAPAPSLDAYIAEAFAPGYFPATLGVGLVACGDGRARLRLPFRPAHRQNAGVLQGGVTATLIDMAMAWAVTSAVHPRGTATVNLDVNYVRPVVDADLECEAVVVRAGRTVATVRAEVMTDDGSVVATGSGNFLLRPPQPAGVRP
ncbi:PaaI family thioesterase [Pseudonocardia sp. H11422]|uniref:PaaI family thioesterase n=1 Tax=Pseudonocardia sp. H11422 TaxID=2835866 RepID=UPI001BDD1293|nr:PaaI family thioesterase [Pseudonocardia sp. H11422]